MVADSLRTIGARQTGRLLLRRPTMRDLDFVSELFALPETVAHRPDPRPDSAEASRKRLEKDIRHWTGHGYGRWAVEADGATIGFGGVTVSEAFGGLNISYHLHPLYWGQGFAGELVGEAVKVAFTVLDAEQVVGLARPANPASCRVLEKAGLLFDRETELHGAPTRLYILRREIFTRNGTPGADW